MDLSLYLNLYDTFPNLLHIKAFNYTNVYIFKLQIAKSLNLKGKFVGINNAFNINGMEQIIIKIINK